MKAYFKQGGLMTLKNKYLDLIGLPQRTAEPSVRKKEQPTMNDRWKEDQRALALLQAENTRLRKIMNTKWSKDWSKIVDGKK